MVKQLFFRSGLSFVGLAIVKLLSTLIFIFLANLFQPDLFGRFSYFLTISSLLTLIFDWGLIQWFQVHWSSEKESSQINEIISTRSVTLIISIFIFIVYNFIFRAFTNFEALWMILLLIPEAYLSIADSYYLVRKQAPFIAIKQFSKYLFPLILILVFPNNINIFSIIFSFVMSSLFTCVWYIPFKTITFSYKSVHVYKTLKASTPYATLLLTSAFYSRGDTVILQNQLGNTAVGLYSAGYRYLDAMSMLPSALAQNLFHLSTQRQLLSFRRVGIITAVMGMAGLFAGGSLYIFSNFLTVKLLGSNYQQTWEIVRLFSLVTVILFINSPLSTIVQSSSLVKRFLPWGIANTVLNIMLNIILIPIAGGVGAASVMLITESTGLLINLYFVQKILRS